MDNSKQSKQVLLSVIGVAILVVAVVGVSFAFFNYTRTGTANTVSTGKIYFNHTQTGTAELSNVFPLTSTQLANDSGKVNHAEVEIAITADTTYSDGLEYRLVAKDVDLITEIAGTNVTVPVSVVVTDKTNSLNTNGTFTTTYTAANAATSTVSEGSVLASGTVTAASTVTAYTGSRYTGTVVVKVYLDASRIAISDTYDESTSPTAQNGTTPQWVNGRLVLTTEQWNSLAEDELTFSIRVESKENGGSYAYSPS